MFPHVGLLPKEEGKQILLLPMPGLLLFSFAWNIIADMLGLEEISGPVLHTPPLKRKWCLEESNKFQIIAVNFDLQS